MNNKHINYIVTALHGNKLIRLLTYEIIIQNVITCAACN